MVWRAFFHAKISRIQNMPATPWSRQPKEKRPHKTTHRRPRATFRQTGLIGVTEPVFASARTLFLPGSFPGFAGIACASDHLIWHLFAGLGLILVANPLLIARPGQPAHNDPQPVT